MASHTWQRFKQSKGSDPNSILECTILPQTEHHTTWCSLACVAADTPSNVCASPGFKCTAINLAQSCNEACALPEGLLVSRFRVRVRVTVTVSFTASTGKKVGSPCAWDSEQVWQRFKRKKGRCPNTTPRGCNIVLNIKNRALRYPGYLASHPMDLLLLALFLFLCLPLPL
jgi:hypothetical protein